MLLASAALFALQHGGASADDYQPKVAEASEDAARALAGVALPEGWTGNVWAAEPLLANPVIFNIDDQGEVYVCETFRLHKGVTDMRDYMGWLEDELACTSVADRRAMFEKHLSAEELEAWSTEHERLRLIRDTDGDGTADESTVFADGFNDLMDGIAAGVLKVGDDVYYTCIPHLWKLRDEDGDGVSDARESLAEGFGVHVALLGHDLHGLVLGPDRRLYYSCGDRGMNLTPSGHDIVLPHEGAVLRCELDGSNLEVVHKGLRNPQELVFDLHGDLFTGDNNSDGGDQARWVHIVPGGDSGWRHHYQYVTEPVLRGPWNSEKQWKPPGENQTAWLNPPIANLGAGPSGLDFAPGTGHPPELNGRFFLCDFRGDPSFSGVWSFALERKGAFYEVAEKEEWLWKTLVTDFQFGPDGYAYWSDWVAGWGMTGKGRVFRMRWEGADEALVEETRQLLAGTFDTIPTAQLEGLLAHPDRRVRQRAHFALADKGAEGLGALNRVAANHPNKFARLHAVWGLWVAGKTDASAVAGLVALLDDADEDVRTQAVRVLGDLRVEGLDAELVAKLDDESARVRFQAGIACGRVGAQGARAGLERMLVDADATNDPNLRHAAVRGIAGCLGWDLDGYDVPENEAIALGHLLAMRETRDEAIVQFLHGAPRLAMEAACAIYEAPIEGALEALANWPWGPAYEQELSGLMAELRPDRAGSFYANRGDQRFLELARNVNFVRRVAAARRRVPMNDQHLLEIVDWPIEESLRVEILEMLVGRDKELGIDVVNGRWRPVDRFGEIDVTNRLSMTDPESPILDLPGDSDDAQLAWIALIDDAPATNEEIAAQALRVIAEDRSRTGVVRARAMKNILEGDSANALELVDLALADDDDLLRAAALEALGSLDPTAALERLDGVLASGTLPERRAAYSVLRTIQGADADALIAEELIKLGAGLVSPELALDLVLAAEGRESELVASLLDAHNAAASTLEPAIAPYLNGLAGGDAARGKKLFESTELSCLRCHSVTGDWSAQIGPSLHDVAERLPALEFVASIVDPNRLIARGFETEMFFPLDDGPPVVGRVSLETPDSVQVIDADGKLHDLTKASIEVRKKDLSAMPNGLADQISREQMRDLLAYLATLSE